MYSTCKTFVLSLSSLSFFVSHNLFHTPPQHEDTAGMGQQELGYLVEERVRILARVEELKARVTELEQQLQDSRQEVRLPLHLLLL